ncbi:hypothetical protein [Erwinia sp. S38]|nr:hypothetical protein [Erwinia sp. S38]
MKMIIAITPLFLLSIQVSALDVELKGSDTVAIKSGATLKK